MVGLSSRQIKPSGSTQLALTTRVWLCLQIVLEACLLHEALERFASDVAWSASSIALVGVALIETVGMWAPVLAIPWASIGARLAVSGCFVGASIIAAETYYHPFDVVIINDKKVGPTHPEDEAAWGFAIVIAIVPLIVGLVTAAKARHLAA